MWKDCLARVVDSHPDTNEFVSLQGGSKYPNLTFFLSPHLLLSSIDQIQLKFQGTCKMGKSEEEPRGINKRNLACFPVFSIVYREKNTDFEVQLLLYS